MIAHNDESARNVDTTDNAAAPLLVSVAIAYAITTLLALGWLAA